MIVHNLHHYSFSNQCPFAVPVFNCSSIWNTTTTANNTIDLKALDEIINEPNKSRYLNPAAPFARVRVSDIRYMGVSGDSVSAGLFAEDKFLTVFKPGGFRVFAIDSRMNWSRRDSCRPRFRPWRSTTVKRHYMQ